MTVEASLVYGYDMGSAEDFRAVERDEYGGPKLPWLPVDEDGDAEYEDLGEELEKALKQADMVRLEYSGHHDNPGYVLYAVGSWCSVAWSETMTLDPAEISAPRPDWNERLAAALTVLGITPTQDGPRWLVFPSYG